MLLQRTALLTALVSLLFISCEKKKEEVPELIVDKSTIAFDESAPTVQIVITNAGDKTLEWEIESPDVWVTFSEASGSLEKGAKIINISANTGISPGSYTTSIRIKSNGGNHTISASIVITDKTTVFPGEGILQLNIYDSYKKLTSTFGTPDEKYHIEIDADRQIYGHELAYYNLGISCIILNNEVKGINDEDEIYFMFIFPPYEAKTIDEIDFESSLADIQDVYGTTLDVDYYTSNGIEAEDYNYTEDGITFTFASENLNDVEYFFIYEPYPASELNATLSRCKTFHEKFQKK